MTPTLFLFFIIVTATANVLDDGDTAALDDEIVDIPLDMSEQLAPITPVNQTVAGVTVEFTKEVKMNTSEQNESITLRSTQLPNIEILIPDQTTISGPDEWDGRLVPPVPIVGGGIVPSGFLIPTGAILVGSANAVLIFDNPATLILNGTIGQTAYKSPNSDTWILISGCTGTFENPNNPPQPGECLISDGTNTKIITFHFTEFAGLPTPAPAESTSSGNSGGHGNTGVGSPRVFGSSGGGGGGGAYYPPGETKQSSFPFWFDSVTSWYKEGKISAIEFLNAYQWIVENLL